MVRLEDRQLNIIMGILFTVTLGLAVIFGIARGGGWLLRGQLVTMDQVSEGWIATYDTINEDKWKQYGTPENGKKTGKITEVLNLPNSFELKAGNEVTLVHKLPNFTADKLYMVFHTHGEHINISVGQVILYDNQDAGDEYGFHVAVIPYEYRDSNLTILLSDENSERISFDEIRLGTFSQLIADAIYEDGTLICFGIFLAIAGIILLIVCCMLKCDEDLKRLLLCGSVEGIVAGILFVMQGRLLHVLLNWEFFCYFLQTCLVIIMAVMHLLVLRSLVIRKKILSTLDTGILFYCVVFVSVMVLQWFGLLTFDTGYYAALVFYGIGVVIYTLLMGAASYDYRQKDGRPMFIANLILIVTLVIWIILRIVGTDAKLVNVVIISGVMVYFAVVWVVGLMHAAYVETTDRKQEKLKTQMIRQQVIDQINPNLLFASFQTLQKMIKKGSDMSTKMIYYISVYVKDNLDALDHQGEVISFEEELNHMIAYMQLQKIRSGSFSFAIECKVKDFRIPRYTLEPIVENAVKYGVGGKENKGNVVVRTYEREEGYAVQIIDDGIGFDAKHLKKHSPTSLKNVLGLLEESCNAKTEIISREGKGTVITIVLPVIDNDLMEENVLEEGDEYE